MKEERDWKKYIIVFLITLALFLTAFGVSTYLSNKKLSNLQTIQDQISVDVLSSEVQYSLLEEQSCSDVTRSVLSKELATFADKIEYSENNKIGNEQSLIDLKKNYSLLEIKDYLLMKKISARCGLKSSFILYFYANSNDCKDCDKQSIVLDTLRNEYPELRVYSFDYNLDLTAINALISIYKIPDTLPAIVLNGKTYNGFQDIETLEKIIGPKPEPKTETTAPAEEEKN